MPWFVLAIQTSKTKKATKLFFGINKFKKAFVAEVITKLVLFFKASCLTLFLIFTAGIFGCQ
jgi:hypothetical protein